MSTELSIRIAEFEAQVAALEAEVRVLTGRLSNRDPKKIAALQAQNADAQKTYRAVKDALALLTQVTLSAQVGPQASDDAALQLDILRQSAMDYFQKTNVDAELWKNLASW